MTVMLCKDLVIMFMKVSDSLLTQMFGTVVCDCVQRDFSAALLPAAQIQVGLHCSGIKLPTSWLAGPIFKFSRIYIYLLSGYRCFLLRLILLSLTSGTPWREESRCIYGYTFQGPCVEARGQPVKIDSSFSLCGSWGPDYIIRPGSVFCYPLNCLVGS